MFVHPKNDLAKECIQLGGEREASEDVISLKHHSVNAIMQYTPLVLTVTGMVERVWITLHHFKSWFYLGVLTLFLDRVVYMTFVVVSWMTKGSMRDDN